MTDQASDGFDPREAYAQDKGELPSNAEKDPGDWVTGDEPMTGAQASYLKTLCEEADAQFNPALTKAEASKRIEALKDQSPRVARRQ